MNRIVTLILFLSIFNCHAQPSFLKKISGDPYNYISSNGRLYFFVNDSLWRSNGTSAGTFFLKKIGEEPVAYTKPEISYVISNKFLFVTTEASGKNAIWSSDGSVPGTKKIASFYDIVPWQVYNNEFYFSTSNGGTHQYIYKINSSFQPVLIKDFQNPEDGIIRTSIPDFTFTNNAVFFFSYTNTNTLLWKITTGVSVLTKKVYEAPGRTIDECTSSNGVVYFNIIDNLYKYNSYTNQGSLIDSSIPYKFKLFDFNNKLYFFSFALYGLEFYSYDGSFRHLETFLGGIGGVPSHVVVNGKLILDLFTGSSDLIYVTNGYTKQAKLIHTSIDRNTFEDDYLITTSKYVFFVDSKGPDYGNNYKLLWQSNTTKEDTRPLSSIFSNGHIQDVKKVIEVNDQIFFTSGDNLWHYNPNAPLGSQSYLTLTDAIHHKDLQWLHNNDTIVVEKGSEIGVRFDHPAINPASIVFKVNDKPFFTDNNNPFCITGDDYGNCLPWNATTGSYKINATPYSGTNGSGTAGTSVTTTIYIINKNPISVSQEAKMNFNGTHASILMYPNPASEELIINSPNFNGKLITISIADCTGNTIYKTESTAANGSITIDLTSLKIQKGMYLLIIESELSKEVKEFIKN